MGLGSASVRPAKHSWIAWLLELSLFLCRGVGVGGGEPIGGGKTERSLETSAKVTAGSYGG